MLVYWIPFFKNKKLQMGSDFDFLQYLTNPFCVQVPCLQVLKPSQQRNWPVWTEAGDTWTPWRRRTGRRQPSSNSGMLSMGHTIRQLSPIKIFLSERKIKCICTCTQSLFQNSLFLKFDASKFLNLMNLGPIYKCVKHNC